MSELHIIENLPDGTSLLQCNCATQKYTDAEAEVSGIDTQKPENLNWSPTTLNLSELTVVEWGESVYVPGATSMATDYGSYVIDIPYKDFDALYRDYLSRRPRFRLS